MRSYFEELCFYYGEEEAYARYKKQLGNLIIATANEDNTTRLFMRSLNPISDLQQKNGWWNTFTITRTPCVAGDYICEIKEVRADKDGYPIFVVEPLTQVDEGLNRSNELMEVFYQSYLFTEKGSHGIGIFNLNYLADKVNEIAPVAYGIGVGGYYEMHAAQAVRLFMDGVITLEQITAWMNEPTDAEKEYAIFAEEVCRFFNSDLEAMVVASEISGLMEPTFFPLTAAKVMKFKAERGYLYTDQKVDFVKNLLWKYEQAVKAGQVEAVENRTIWHQIEAYLQFDKERKMAQKAAKTAAKKAKKAAAKA